MTRLSSRARLYAPRVRETGWPKPLPLPYYGDYLGEHGQFEASLGHFERAIDILGAQGEQLRQALYMASGGRCL